MQSLKQSQSSESGKFGGIKKNLSNPRYLLPVMAVLVVLVFLAFRSNSEDRMHIFYRVILDTSVELQISASSSAKAELVRDDVFAEMERLEELFSRSISGSEVSAINNSAGKGPISVDQEVFYVTMQALHYSEISNGAFDPTVAPLIDLWGFLGQEYRLPAPEEIEGVLPLVDYRLVEFNDNNSELYLPKEEMALELGGIAKGYIIDRALAVIRNAGIESAFVNVGGDIGMIGVKPDGNLWRIGIRNPRNDSNVIAVLPAFDGAVVTSGDYERVFEVDGKSYHHILDPNDGMPAGVLSSVTIAAETAIAADALSTAVFVMGPVEGMELIENLPGVECIIITPGLEILVSSGLQELAELNP
jgi:FAD:protein FMN transferase